MWKLNIDLFSDLHIIGVGDSTASSEILECFSMDIPYDYKEFVRGAGGIELGLDTKNGPYFRIWGYKKAVEMNNAYMFQDTIPNSFAFGDDEGGCSLIYLSGEEGFGVYIIDCAVPIISAALFLCPSLNDLLVNGIGLGEIWSLYS